MSRKLIFLEGAYDTLDLFAEELRHIYEEQGYETLVLQMENLEESIGKLMQFASTKVEAVLTFNNLGFYLELGDGKNLWDELGICCINILMDHPFRYHRFLLKAPENSVVLCTDRNHVEYIQRFYPAVKKTGFLPHGGIRQMERRKPMEKRSIEVLYAGSLSRHAAEGLIPDLGNITEYDGFDLSRKVLSELISSPSRTTEAVIEDYFLKQGLHMPDERLREEISRLRFLDVYATSFFREQAVRYLVEHGIPVTVYGQGWSECEWANNKNLTCGGMIPAVEVLRQMGESKIVLNTMTWFKAGAHDRIFNGMLAGAGVVTDTSSYVEEKLVDKKEAAIFRLEELSGLPGLVEGLLNCTAELQEMADMGYQKAKEEHTWERRAEELRNYFSH